MNYPGELIFNQWNIALNRIGEISQLNPDLIIDNFELSYGLHIIPGIGTYPPPPSPGTTARKKQQLLKINTSQSTESQTTIPVESPHSSS